MSNLKQVKHLCAPPIPNCLRRRRYFGTITLPAAPTTLLSHSNAISARFT
ncbi:MAG: hypothetical protein JSU01_17350 [Bacteroidetes bacterium]|nr:hypothetical protein [Bacteroidota bacterium]